MERKFSSSQISFLGQRSRGIKQNSNKKIVTANNGTATGGWGGGQTHDRSKTGSSMRRGNNRSAGNNMRVGNNARAGNIMRAGNNTSLANNMSWQHESW